MADTKKNNWGKKVFFLYPHSVIRDEMISTLIRSEYEIYLLKNHEAAVSVLEKYDDSILFINIDEELTEPEWEKYIKNIMESEKTKNVRIGILTYNEDASLAKKYLMDLMIPCGFIKLRLGLIESTKIMLATLDSNEAKGTRKFVRAKCETSATFNLDFNNKRYSGIINDLSVVGMACVFDKNVDIKLHTIFKNIQLNLKGILCRLTGFVAGIRKLESNVYVIMFKQNMGDDMREKIRNFIHKLLQKEIDIIANKEVKTK